MTSISFFVSAVVLAAVTAVTGGCSRDDSGGGGGGGAGGNDNDGAAQCLPPDSDCDAEVDFCCSVEPGASDHKCWDGTCATCGVFGDSCDGDDRKDNTCCTGRCLNGRCCADVRQSCNSVSDCCGQQWRCESTCCLPSGETTAWGLECCSGKALDVYIDYDTHEQFTYDGPNRYYAFGRCT